MLEKITEQELDQYGVVSAPDHLTGRPADVKAVFDRLVRDLVAAVVNRIIDAHNGLDESVNKRIDDVIEELKNVSQINAENLGSNNIVLDKAGETALAELYATGELVPTVHGALKKLGALGTMVDYLADPGTFLKPETAALFGLDETAVPDDVLAKIGNEFPRIAVGTATGNSYASADEPNSLTFPFQPKLVVLMKADVDYRPSSYSGYGYFVWLEGVTTHGVTADNYGTRHRCFRREGNTLYWWSDYPEKVPAAICGNYVAFG